MDLELTRPRLSVLACAAFISLGIALFGASGQAQAWGETGISPESGGWCGLTDDGGTIRFEATGDRRYVQSVAINLMSGAVSVGESSLTTRAQVKSSKFILRGSTAAVPEQGGSTQPRRPGGPGRCVRVPCRPISAAPGAPSPRAPQDDILVRGTFEATDSVAGTFKFGASVGYYTAWPARFGCP